MAKSSAVLLQKKCSWLSLTEDLKSGGMCLSSETITFQTGTGISMTAFVSLNAH